MYKIILNSDILTGVGSCILNMDDEKLCLELVGWKGFLTLKAYINGECRMHYLRLLGADVSQFGNIYVLIKLNFILMKIFF